MPSSTRLRRFRRLLRLEPLEPRQLLAVVVDAGVDLAQVEGGLVTLEAGFVDNEVAGPYTATVDWGDGTPPEAAQVNTTTSAAGSLSVAIDYRYDAPAQGGSNFFDTQAKRDLLQAAADLIVGRFGDELLAIAPGASGTPGITNSFTAVFNNPSTGASTQLVDLSVAADEIIVFAGARDLGSTLGIGGPGGFSASGTQEFLDIAGARGQSGALAATATDFGLWGGALTFNTNKTWHYGASTDGLGSGENDFFSIALHEFLHLFGFGTAESFDAQVSGGTFTGPAAAAAYDGSGNPPLHADNSHWAEDTEDGGAETIMDPTITVGTRKLLTDLDMAAMEDLGWELLPAAGIDGMVSATHSYADDGSYTAQVTVSSSGGGPDSDALQVTVANVAPVVTTDPIGGASLGQPVTLTASFSDAGSADTHTATIDWGDGTLEPATVDAAAGTLSGSHTYASAGDFTVRATVRDDEGDEGEDTVPVSITGPSGVPPVARDDNDLSTGEGVPLSIDVLANDSAGDSPLDPLSIVVTRPPDRGEAELDVSSGQVLYTPDPGFVGSDTFGYTVRDEDGDQSAEAMVSVTLTVRPFPWQHPIEPLDVNGDDSVSSIDALQVINELNLHRFSDPQNGALVDAPPSPTPPSSWYDTNGDGFVSPIDALRVINELNRRAAPAFGQAAPVEAPAEAAIAEPNGPPAAETPAAETPPAAEEPARAVATARWIDTRAVPVDREEALLAEGLPTGAAPADERPASSQEESVDAFFFELGEETLRAEARDNRLPLALALDDPLAVEVDGEL